jgi:dTDP-4-amino-4,6-dideoxygalactose transaminase
MINVAKYKIPYLDLSVKDESLRTELLESVDHVLRHGRIVLGPEVEEFEKIVANRAKRGSCVGVNSGTDALYLALRALDIGPGDEVITTPLSWIATFHAIALCGAVPVCVDIGDDLNMDSGLIEGAVTPRTRAIVAVHFTGHLCDMETIMQVARKHKLHVVEDAAQAFTANSPAGVAGSFGVISSFSMNPMKVLCAFGEAGAVVLDDTELVEKLKSLRYSGTISREKCQNISLNARLDTIHAAMLMVQLKRLDAKIDRRREIARMYQEFLKGIVRCPVESEGWRHVFYTYTICADHRDELMKYLSENGIESKIHHRILMPHQQAYQYLHQPQIPNAERLREQILSIPNHENLSDNDVQYVAKTVRDFYGA